MLFIILIAWIIQMTLWDELLRVGEIGRGMARGQMTDGDDRLQIARGG